MKIIIEKLKKLRLKNCAQNIVNIIEQATQKNLSPLQAIERLIDIEIEERDKARMILRYKQSRLDTKVTIDQFNFNYHKSRQAQKSMILNLMDVDFIEKKKDIIMIGNPGTGKSYLAKCIAFAATQAGIKTLFTTAMDMVNHLIAAEADHNLLKKLKYYQSPDILVVDEIGYLPLGQQGSNLIFQVISARHEKKSTMITTNLPFAQWGNIFDSTTVATAIAD
ncbi:MAG: IS21-like element helper ATPase IstB, partial [Desulfobacterales bacterium]|nr:IS21-like element helper ATPase IstB [Desulfobacterales bacterium]